MTMKNTSGFPPRGICYFWCLNDICDERLIDEQIAEFSRAGVSTVCLHPRDGLLLPYGSAGWFDFIRRTAVKLAARKIGVWLYDEDPFPSGSAGGRITLDHPEFTAKKIVMHQADAVSITEEGLWCFPANGKLLFCALLYKETGKLISDKTEEVGIVRRKWEILKNWDSRWYYPATPLYVSDRAMANVPEYALKSGGIQDGQILAAFTVETVHDQKWGSYADPLNPLATQKFIEYTHEKYYQSAGDMFGNEITAIFTDEAKYYGETPWTPGIFEDFQQKFGYDLKLRLYDLFSDIEQPEVIRTKANYREWCGKRFEEAWLKPVSVWCKSHNLKLVGHMSPEEDPVSQSETLSNLMPLQKHLSLAGLDLIVPAAGDKNHPLLNIGILVAVSSAQQHRLAGVMSESLACSGKDFTIEKARLILNWQTVMGMTTPVIHGIFHSLRAEREFECPPDFGPSSKFRDGLIQLDRDLRPVQDMLLGATQIASVAILWPIKSFHIIKKFWQAEPGGLRGELTGLINACLEAHIGIHLLDEEDFLNAKISRGILKAGDAGYSHIIVPGSTIWKKSTWDLLVKYAASDLSIYQYGTRPRYLETPAGVEENDDYVFEELTDTLIRSRLPKLLDIDTPDSEAVRASGWTRDNNKFHLLCYLGESTIKAQINGKEYELSSQKITTV